jgi:hypothetical protein
LGRKAVATRLGAAVFVVLRGIMLLGYVYFVGFVIYGIQSVLGKQHDPDDDDPADTRRAARLYSLYLAITIGMVVWFFWAFRFGAGQV